MVPSLSSIAAASSSGRMLEVSPSFSNTGSNSILAWLVEDKILPCSMLVLDRRQGCSDGPAMYPFLCLGRDL